MKTYFVNVALFLLGFASCYIWLQDQDQSVTIQASAPMVENNLEIESPPKPPSVQKPPQQVITKANSFPELDEKSRREIIEVHLKDLPPLTESQKKGPPAEDTAWLASLDRIEFEQKLLEDNVNSNLQASAGLEETQEIKYPIDHSVKH